jgi:hypothetical protein
MGLLTKKVAEASVSFAESPGQAFGTTDGIPAEVRVDSTGNLAARNRSRCLDRSEPSGS